MRILIVCNHHVVSHARYMRDAYRRLGVDVRTIGPAFGSEIWGVKLAADRVWNPDGPLDACWPDWMPDLVVFSMERPFVRQARYAHVPHVVHVVDNHVLDFRQAGIDHYFLSHLHGPVMPARGEDVTWLPCAYDPVMFSPSAIPWSQRKFDASLIGVLYPQRVELINALRQAGVMVNAGTGAVFEEFRDIHHNTRISLCLSLKGDVAQRIFETAAMRCLVLSDPCPDFSELRADGIVFFRSIPEAVARAKELLADSAIAESLIERSFAWAKPHTWDARAEIILRWLKDRNQNSQKNS